MERINAEKVKSQHQKGSKLTIECFHAYITLPQNYNITDTYSLKSHNLWVFSIDELKDNIVKIQAAGDHQGGEDGQMDFLRGKSDSSELHFPTLWGE